MKILEATFKNFKGIYYGMGITELTLDFSKSNNRIIVLAGKNGSGKTTILSIMHIFPNTFDGRKSIILDGKDGRKYLKIEHNGEIYEVEHIYKNRTKTKSIKSFFRKLVDGQFVDINEKNNVTEFKKAVLEEWGIDEDFFKLIQLGDNVENFVKLSSTKRKNFMSGLLPNIDRFLEYFDKYNKHWSKIKERISHTSKEIKKLGDEDVLNTNLKSLQKNIDVLEKNIKNYEADLNKNIGKIQSYPDHEKLMKEYSKAQRRLKEVREELKDDKDLIESNLSKYKIFTGKNLDDIEEDLDTLKGARIRNNTLKDEKSNSIETAKKEIIDLNTELEPIKIELENLKEDNTLESLKEVLKNAKSDLKENEELYEDLKEYEKFGFEESDIQTYDNLMTSTIDKLKIIHLSSEDIDYFKEFDYSIDELKREKSKISGSIKKKSTKLSEVQSSLDMHTGKLELADILKQRPTNCGVDTCPFISESLKWENVQELIDEDEEVIKRLRSNIKKLEDKKEIVSKKLNFLTQLDNLYSNFEANSNILELFPYYDTINTLPKFIDFALADKLKYISDTENWYDYCIVKNKIDNLRNVQIPRTKTEIERLENKQSEIKYLNKQITDIEEKLNEKKESLKILKEQKEDLITKLNRNKTRTNIFTDHRNALERAESNEDEIKEIELFIKKNQDSVEALKELQSENSDIEESIEDFKEELDPLNTNLDKVKYDITRLKEFREDLDSYQGLFEKLTILRDATSTSKGIPLFYIYDYLNSIKSDVNNLLDVAFKGFFRVKDFTLSESDFFIKMNKATKGIIDDVTETSQGEVALTSLCISFATIFKNLSDKKTVYNIPLLDEADATLDTGNRIAFIEILNALLDLLKAEQCFIISHNNEFDYHALDMILLDGHSFNTEDKKFMKNKNIIFKSK